MLLTVIGFGIISNYSALLFGDVTFTGTIFFVFSMTLTGLFVYALTWYQYVQEPQSGQRNQNFLLLVSSTIAFLLFMIPALGIQLTNLVYFSYLVFGVIVVYHYLTSNNYGKGKQLAILSILLLIYPALRLIIHEEILTGNAAMLISNPIFNVTVLTFFALLLVAFRKQQLFKYFIIMMISLHMIPGL
jgi:hypothetical protein